VGQPRLLRQISTEADTVFLDLRRSICTRARQLEWRRVTTRALAWRRHFSLARRSEWNALKEHARNERGTNPCAMTDWLVNGSGCAVVGARRRRRIVCAHIHDLRQRPLGFSTEHVLLVTIDASRAKSIRGRHAVVERSREPFARLPGVSEAALL